MAVTKRRIVVTGGAGFIGSHIVDKLIEEGHEVVVVDNLKTGKTSNVNQGAKIIVADIRNIDDLIRVFANTDTVFHLAALPSVQESIDDPVESFFVNVFGTHNVLEAARVAKVRRVVFSSSSAIYGDQGFVSLHEQMKQKALSPYAAHKYCGEVLCKQYSIHFGVETVCLRYFNVYGPRLNPDGAYALVIGAFLKQKSLGIPLKITGDGKQSRDFIHVHDVANANILAMDSPKTKNGEVINIGSGYNTQIDELAFIFNHPFEYVPARVEPLYSVSNNQLALSLLEWEPTINLEDGIDMLLQEWGL